LGFAKSSGVVDDRVLRQIYILIVTNLRYLPKYEAFTCVSDGLSALYKHRGESCADSLGSPHLRVIATEEILCCGPTLGIVKNHCPVFWPRQKGQW
jgi:hypothetical protein